MLNQCLQLADELAVASQRQVRLDALLDRRQTQLLGLGDRRLSERLIREVGQRQAAPQLKPSEQHPRRLRRLTGHERATALLDQSAKAVEVKLTRRDPQQITVPTSHQDLVR